MNLNCEGVDIMATTSSATTTTGASFQAIGLYVQAAGAGAFIVVGILSLHHYAIGICFIAGAAAFFLGKKMRGGAA